MTFDEKIDKAERLFKYSKAVKFLDPKYSFYSMGAGLIFWAMGDHGMSNFIMLTVITVSIIAILLLKVSHRLFTKGIRLVTEADLDRNEVTDYDELLRRVGRQLKALQSSI